MGFHERRADSSFEACSPDRVDKINFFTSFDDVHWNASGWFAAWGALHGVHMGFAHPSKLSWTCLRKLIKRYPKNDGVSGPSLSCDAFPQIPLRFVRRSFPLTGAAVTWTKTISQRNSADCFDNNTFARCDSLMGNARWNVVTCMCFSSETSSRAHSVWRQLHTNKRLASSKAIAEFV